MPDQLQHYYNRFVPTSNYEQLMFRAGYVLQSAELNEIQSIALDRIQGISDAIFKDGDLISDAQISIDQATGITQCSAGAVYLRGAVRNVPAATITIPVDSTISIGLYLVETVITEMDDPSLRDPATEVRNYQEAGAGRLKIDAVWGWQGTGVSDAQAGEFYPIYTADYAIMRVKITPPQLDSVSQAIASYDRDSTGGNYVVSGLKATKLPDIDGVQQYSVEAGAARVNGFSVPLGTSRRIPYAAVAELRYIDSEPFLSTTMGAQRVTFDRTPVDSITQVRITGQDVTELVHGTFSGASDPLPDTSIVEIIAVNQGGALSADGSSFVGGTTYLLGTDYKLTGQKVDWSLPGAEPSNSSTYKVIYRHIKTVAPTNVDAAGFTVTGAVVGTLIQTSYNVKLPRIDRLCLTKDGSFVWINGTSTDWNPVPPQVPADNLPLAQVSQTWGDDASLSNDGLRVIPMKDIEAINTRLDLVVSMIASQQLTSDAQSRSAAAKKGLFVDPFLDDSLRDAGVAQTAAIVNGELILPIDVVMTRPSLDVKAAQVLNCNLTSIFQQGAITGSMLVNPYQAYDPIPAALVLDPPVDHFTSTTSVFASDRTAVVVASVIDQGLLRTGYQGTSTVTLSTTSKAQAYMRSIDVAFTIAGFNPGEQVAAITFDGVAVTPKAA